MEPPPDHLRDYISKVCRLMMPAIPEEVQQKVLEDVDDMPQITAVAILDEVWNYVAPGCQEDMEGLTKYVRNPGCANTAAEARPHIRTWVLARRRVTVMHIPYLSSIERLKALEKLIEKVEK